MHEVKSTKASAVSEHLHHKKASYPAKHFVDNSQFSELLRIIEQNPLATLVFSDNNQQLHLSHIPFHLSEQTLANINTEQCDSLITQTLLGHVSNHHPVAQQLTSNRQINCEKTPVNISLIFVGFGLQGELISNPYVLHR